MQYERKTFAINKLVQTWKSGSLKINEEYQRGAEWTQPQMQGLIDSIFRKYPIPPIFLHQIKDVGLDEQETVRFEIVDGQQRIRALADYLSGKFPSLDAATDKRLRLPNSLRKLPAPWGKKKFAELDEALRTELETKQIDVFVISELVDPDEVRDLFIRLQSGTALSRQQIRDAWPGTIGPFVVGLAGKMDSTPSETLFRQIDRRGAGVAKSEDDSDQYDTDRQFCAQLLCLYLARESDINSEQSIGANDLDKVYHDYTTFDVDGETAKRFKEILRISGLVFTLALAKTITDKNKRVKAKFRKLDVIAVFLLLQDLLRNKQFKVEQTFLQKLAAYVLEERDGTATGKSTSGPGIAKHYADWRSKLPEDLGVRTDPRRVFTEDQKLQMLARDGSNCKECGAPLTLEDAEGDHYPKPWRDGGRTEIDNGRLVHKKCHERGRPPAPAIE